MIFLYGADWHLRASVPACRKDRDFYDAQMRKLAIVVQWGQRAGIDCFVHGGDFFDSHDPTLRLINDTMATLKQAPRPWLVNPGNHDFFGANTASLRRSGLGILAQAGLITTYPQRTEVEMQDVVFRFLPYSLTLNDDDYNFEMKVPGKVYIIVAHDMIVTHFVPYPHKLITALKTNADLVLCSHWHAQFDLTANGVRFVNPGPLTRQTTHEARIEPSVSYVETDGAGHFQVSQWKVQAAPSSDVIDATRNEDANAVGIAEQFLNALRSHTIEATDRQSLIRAVGQKHQFAEDVIAHAVCRVQETEKVMEGI